MKKLKLNVDELTVTSFTAHAETTQRHTVYGRDSYGTDFYCGTWELNCTNPTRQQTQCFCTDEEGCYPSMYCSDIGPGMPNNSCGEGCMTNWQGAC
ncbi:MAG TPA: hypothetical protein VFQ76_12235 [Longimicrobiaceae bacterium]|nr:hypothetical protein [Longimicrobiaceae bacterium]